MDYGISKIEDLGCYNGDTHFWKEEFPSKMGNRSLIIQKLTKITKIARFIYFENNKLLFVKMISECPSQPPLQKL